MALDNVSQWTIQSATIVTNNIHQTFILISNIMQCVSSERLFFDHHASSPQMRRPVRGLLKMQAWQETSHLQQMGHVWAIHTPPIQWVSVRAPALKWKGRQLQINVNLGLQKYLGFFKHLLHLLLLFIT